MYVLELEYVGGKVHRCTSVCTSYTTLCSRKRRIEFRKLDPLCTFVERKCCCSGYG